MWLIELFFGLVAVFFVLGYWPVILMTLVAAIVWPLGAVVSLFDKPEKKSKD